jgi:hypothetical protein
MFARQLAVARPLVQRASIVPLSAVQTRSYMVGFPRKPIAEPLDPVYYPSLNDAIDPGQVGAVGSSIVRALLIWSERRIREPTSREASVQGPLRRVVG